MPNRPKKQHYIPQLLLREFCTSEKEQVFVFDKRRGISYPSAIRDAGSENYFNDVHIGEYWISFENRFEMVEAYAAPVIKRIATTEDVSNLSAEDQASLVVFIATQLVRTNASRVAMSQAHDLLVEKLGGEERAARAGVPRKNLELQKFTILEGLPDAITKFGNYLAEKFIVLQKASGSDRFILGDDPVARDNNLNKTDGPGRFGIANKGIEIYLPVTPKLVLSLICPSVIEFMERVSASNSHFASFEADRFLHSCKSGKPFLLNYQNVRRLNSIQIANATRFVISKVDDFSLAKEMIKGRPAIALGPKYVF